MVNSGVAIVVGLFISIPLFAYERRELPFQPESPGYYSEKVQNLESEMIELHQKFKDEGFSSSTFYENVIEPLHSGQDLNENWLNQFDSRYSSLHKMRHLEILQKLHVLMTATHSYVVSLVENLRSEGSDLAESEKAELNQGFLKLEEKFINWASYSDALGEGAIQKEQAIRMYSFSNYFKILRSTLQKLRYAPPLRSKVDSSVGWFTHYSQLALMNAASTCTSVRCLATASMFWFPRVLPVPKNTTPLTTGHLGVVTAFQALAKSQGYQIEIKNKEYLDRLASSGESGQKVINLFIPPHRHAFKDGVSVTSLNLPDYLMFANPSAFAVFKLLGIKFEFFARAVASRPEVIPVGPILGVGPHPKKTMDQFLDVVGLGMSSNAFNHLQGFVANAGEILPLSASAVQGLFKKILDQGFELNLIPLSFETDSDFLSETGDVDDHHLVVKVHPPILHRATVKLVNYQLSHSDEHKYYIEHFFSTLWLENMTRHGELTWDELMNHRFRHALGFDFNPQSRAQSGSKSVRPKSE